MSDNFRPFTADEVTFSISIEPEYEDLRNFFDEEVAAEVGRMCEAGNDWAWCVVKVTARRGLLESDPVYLGACSYADEADFKAGGYYESMCSDALHSLNEVAELVYRDLHH